MCEHLRREITKHIDNKQAVKDFGAFVTIEQNVDGLCHRSEYSLSSAPSKGDSVYVKIIKIEYDSGKVAMSMSSVNQETGQENKEKRFYKVDLGSRSKWISKRSPYPKHKLTSTSYVSSHLHANDAVYLSEYGTVITNESLATFDADIDSGNVRLKAAPTSSDSTVFKIFRTVMNS